MHDVGNKSTVEVLGAQAGSVVATVREGVVARETVSADLATAVDGAGSVDTADDSTNCC